MYRVELTRQAEKAFALLSRSQPQMARRVAHAIDQLALEPECGVSLRGELKGLYKYRVGPYRIIYQVLRVRLLVTVIDIGHRREVYR